jgi:hypothetical protein
MEPLYWKPPSCKPMFETIPARTEQPADPTDAPQNTSDQDPPEDNL